MPTIRSEVGSSRYKLSSQAMVKLGDPCTEQPGGNQVDVPTSTVLKLDIYTCHGWDDRVVFMIFFPSFK